MEGSEHEISRREVLKRVGAGTAIAWSAPVLTSLNTPAFAQGSPAPSPCPACPATCFGDPQFLDAICGSTGPEGRCINSCDCNGNCVCWEDDFCDNRPDAGPDCSCPAGQVAISTCCDQSGETALKCWDPCGTNPSARRTRRRRSGGPTGSGAHSR